MSIAAFEKIFGTKPEFEIRAPGRTELGGNHTDHQHGRVLAAPVNLYARAWVRRNGTKTVNVYSEGYEPFSTDISDTAIKPEEYGTTGSLVRGVAAAFAGYGTEGFDAYITSDIPPGSGLSSSAALEILLGRIFCRLTGVKKTGEELAILGQYVENKYFGKPCGLMDQMACAADGIITIDFKDPAKPVSESLFYDFKAAGYELCIIKSGAGHENLTQNYADITVELGEICKLLGGEVLRDIPEEKFYQSIPQIRKACGDRAVLRAMHVYADNKRVVDQVQALKDNDIDKYLSLVNESGRSSWQLLQNVIPEGQSFHQEMALALAVARRSLGGRGAVRVHGGGFAGTIQAYVPVDMKEEFRASVEAVLGADSCIFAHCLPDIVSVETMRKSDAWTIQNKIPSKELMKRAGEGIYQAGTWKAPVAVVCGKGNNAGDGYVVASLLREHGIDCRIILTTDKFSEDGKYYFDKCVEAGVPCEKYSENTDLSSYSTILDCLLGTGFQGRVEGTLREVTEKINSSGAYVISADINSGLNGDTGEGSVFVKSDLTVSIGAFKLGHFNGMAREAMKEKVNCDIGIEIIE